MHSIKGNENNNQMQSYPFLPNAVISLFLQSSRLIHPFARAMRLKVFLLFISLSFLISCSYLRETPSFREGESTSGRQPRRPASQRENANFYTEHSRLLGYTLNGNENPALIREVASWMGTPYRAGGTTRAGADCSGFVKMVYRAVYNIDLDRVTVHMAQNSSRVNKRNLREGDLVFFRINGRKISHVGIYLSNNKFIHASTSRGVMVNDLDEAYYSQRFAFGGRVRR
ncbi:MAG: C40 family peptidase [Bacteroidales bacterium]